jgi:hypothetical protein
MAAQRTNTVMPSIAAITGFRGPVGGVGVDKTKIPAIPKVEKSIPIYYGSNYAIALAMLQIEKSTKHLTIVQAVASAVANIMDKRLNFSGSDAEVIDLTGDEKISGSTLDENAITNIPKLEEITNADWAEVAAYDAAEHAAYFGILMRAIVNLPEPNASLDAFNKNRVSAATKAVMQDPAIFRPGSRWIKHEILRKVNAAFAFYPACRINMFKQIIDLNKGVFDGRAGIFLDIFELLENSGLTHFVVVKIALQKAPEIVQQFPEIYSELEIMNSAFGKLAAEQSPYKAYAKAMFQEKWVPVRPGDVAQLTAICQRISAVYIKTMGDYKVGEMTDTQREKLDKILTARGAIEALEDDDEELVEVPTVTQAV